MSISASSRRRLTSWLCNVFGDDVRNPFATLASTLQSILSQHLISRRSRRLEHRILPATRLGESNNIPYTLAPGQDGNETVKAEGYTAMRWCAELECREEVGEAGYFVFV